MSVFLRKGKWVVDYWPQGRKGKHIRKTLPPGITTEAEALAIEGFMRAAAGNKEEISASVNESIRTLFPKYLDWYKLHRAATTYKDISSVWNNHLSEHMGQYSANSISLSHIEAYKRIRVGELRIPKKGQKTKGPDAKKLTPCSNRSIMKEIAYFTGFLTWCARNIKGFERKVMYIEKLPHNAPLPHVLSFDEAVRLIMAADPYYRAFLLLLFNLGVRSREARHLKWQDVDLDSRTLKVQKKGGDFNVLPITDWLQQELSKLKKNSSSEWVFESRRKPGTPIVDVRKTLATAKKNANISKRVYPHLLRHSLGTHLLGADINQKTIQSILGHKQIQTTDIYTSLVTDNKRMALNRAGLNIKPPKRIQQTAKTRQKSGGGVYTKNKKGLKHAV